MRYNRPRRNKFRSNDRGFRRNDSQDSRIHGINSVSKNFQKTFFGRNGLKAEKLLEKYNGLAKEALLNGDKILSESYFQHTEHYARILIENGKFDTTSSANGDAKNKNHSIKDAKNSDNESIEKESNIDESQKLQNDETLAAKIEDTPLKEENI